MSRKQVVLLTLVAMLAFAGNSLLCRLALQQGGMDPASFTLVRLGSGALVLWTIIRLRGFSGLPGSWGSALALFAYAAGFSFAYVSLAAGTGALLLFGAVQVTMIGYGLWRGERLSPRQRLGLLLALGGLVGLLLPGLSAPPLAGALLMLGGGVAWGVYSIRGRGAGDATAVTAGNFLRAVPLALGLGLLALPGVNFNAGGVLYAVLSGGIASGLGYALWYAALRGLQATTAATVQLSVPLLTAVGGTLFLGEAVSLRLILASVAILGGIALVIRARAG